MLQDDKRRAHTTSNLEGRPEAILEELVEHVSENGSLISYCLEYGYKPGLVSAWIATDPVRLEAYKGALKLREEFAKEAILHELRCVAHFDIRQLYGDGGELLPVHAWPESAARAVAAMESFEEYTGYGADREKSGDVRKVKTTDKLKGLELLGKNLALFSERVVHSGEVTLLDLLSPAKSE